MRTIEHIDRISYSQPGNSSFGKPVGKQQRCMKERDSLHCEATYHDFICSFMVCTAIVMTSQQFLMREDVFSASWRPAMKQLWW